MNIYILNVPSINQANRHLDLCLRCWAKGHNSTYKFWHLRQMGALWDKARNSSVFEFQIITRMRSCTGLQIFTSIMRNSSDSFFRNAEASDTIHHSKQLHLKSQLIFWLWTISENLLSDWTVFWNLQSAYWCYCGFRPASSLKLKKSQTYCQDNISVSPKQ